MTSPTFYDIDVKEQFLFNSLKALEEKVLHVEIFTGTLKTDMQKILQYLEGNYVKVTPNLKDMGVKWNLVTVDFTRDILWYQGKKYSVEEFKSKFLKRRSMENKNAL